MISMINTCKFYDIINLQSPSNFNADNRIWPPRDYDRSAVGSSSNRQNLYKNLHPWDLRFLINTRRAQRQPLKVRDSSGIRKKKEYKKNDHQPSDLSYPKSTQIGLKLPRAQPPKVRGDSSGMRDREKEDRLLAYLDVLTKSDLAREQLLKVGDPITEVMRYLSPCLLRKKDKGSVELERVSADCLDGKKYVILFSVTFSPQIDDLYLFHALQDVVPDLLADGRLDFEVVMVPRLDPGFPNSDDANYASARELFERVLPVSFLAVPIGDFDRCSNLCRLVGDFMVVDLEEAKVSLKSPTPFHKYGADFYPFTDERREELYTELNLPIRRGCVPLASILRRKSSDILDCVHHPAGSSCGKQQSLSNLTNKLVGVYMLSDGNSKGKVLEVYKQCKEKKLEFEIILVCAKRAPPLWSSSAWEDYVDSFVKNPDCCGWLKLPFDDRVCRRLHHLVLERYGWDSLTIIGPNNKYMDPHGLETIYENGIDGYPFTKQSICDNHETRIRSLDLQGLLNTVGIHHLIRHDGERVHISSVKDTDVLLCLGSCSSPITTASWDLLNWFHEMKRTSRKARFEMIYACLSKSNKCDECLARGGPWLSVSCKKDGNRCLALRDLLYGGLPYFTNKNSLVAFGSDGRVRRLSLQFTLLKKTGPATFPESDENLLRDVEVMLVSRCNQHWNSFSVARHKSHGQPSRSLAYYSNY